jgi:hypothetical protein
MRFLQTMHVTIGGSKKTSQFGTTKWFSPSIFPQFAEVVLLAEKSNRCDLTVAPYY